jgi:hypothetical protein
MCAFYIINQCIQLSLYRTVAIWEIFLPSPYVGQGKLVQTGSIPCYAVFVKDNSNKFLCSVTPGSGFQYKHK